MKNKELKRKYLHIQIVTGIFIGIGFLAFFYGYFKQMDLLKVYLICFMIYCAGFLYKSTRSKALMEQAKEYLYTTELFEHPSDLNLEQYEKISIKDKVFYLMNDQKENIYIAKIKTLEDINNYLNPFVEACHNDLKAVRNAKAVGLLFVFDTISDSALFVIRDNPVANLPIHMRKLKKAYMFLSAYDENTKTFYFQDHVSEIIFSKNDVVNTLISKIETLYKK